MGRAVWVGLAARLMFAGWDRTRALRSELPHTFIGCSRDGVQSAGGDRCCSGGRPAHGQDGCLAGLQPGGAGESKVVHDSQGLVALASAHKNPASSRAMAVMTTLRLCLRASRRR